jgi:RNA polymerase sigma factor (sigma-70 family)
MLGNGEDARDVVHSLFADLYQRGETPLDLAYLYRAVTNRCLSLLRDEANRARLLERHDLALGPPHRTPCDESVIGHDLLAKLARELDHGACEVMVYRYLDDMTQEEIAALLGLSRKTIGKRLDQIRETVGRLMAGGEDGMP